MLLQYSWNLASSLNVRKLFVKWRCRLMMKGENEGVPSWCLQNYSNCLSCEIIHWASLLKPLASISTKSFISPYGEAFCVIRELLSRSVLFMRCIMSPLQNSLPIMLICSNSNFGSRSFLIICCSSYVSSPSKTLTLEPGRILINSKMFLTAYFRTLRNSGLRLPSVWQL